MILRILLIVLFLIGFSACINQEKNSGESEANAVQPELDEEGFFKLLNNILVEKVRLEMFDIQDGSYIYIRNTLDHNKREIGIRMSRSETDVHISVNPGHFGTSSAFPEMIDTRGLFTPQLESQVDLTPPSTFKETRRYDIEVMGYRGILNVSRGHVSFYFGNIGGLSPSPTYPTPTGYAIYYLVGGSIALILGIVVFVIFIWRRRTKS
ncbi:MAG: hypothetical protein HXS44_17980 [Theionarchaea archaeon]|nr:hypothetical protein [Theionarchaea archaeon]